MKNIGSEILNKKYFIFDIDGTLIDSMGMWNYVDQQIVKKYTGVEVPLMEIKMFRDSVLYNNQNVNGDIYLIYYDELIKNFNLPVVVDDFRQQRGDLSRYISINELDYKPGAAKLLNILAEMGKKLGVATTTTTRQYSIYQNDNKHLIRQAPLKKLIDVAVLCEDVERKKPDPECYLKVMQAFHAKPEECIVFEDSLNGVISAKEAGIDVVAVYDASAENEQDLISKIADYKVETFDEFIKLLGLDKQQAQPQG